MKKCDNFCLFKTQIVGTCQNRLTEAVLTSTQDLKHKNVYPGKPQFSNIKVRCKGVFITQTCFHDQNEDAKSSFTPFYSKNKDILLLNNPLSCKNEDILLCYYPLFIERTKDIFCHTTYLL